MDILHKTCYEMAVVLNLKFLEINVVKWVED